MRKSHTTTLTILASLLPGCELLLPHGGDQDVEYVVEHAASMPDELELLNPETDATIRAISLMPETSGPTFVFDALEFELTFDAPDRNVVGAGFVIENPEDQSVLVKWRKFPDVVGKLGASDDTSLTLTVSLDDGICASLSNDCHATTLGIVVVTDQNAVSNRLPVDIVVNCGTCEAPTCLQDYPGFCKVCAQPESCQALEAACTSEMAWPFQNVFDVSFGANGTFWGFAPGCMLGEQLCEEFLNAGEEPNCELQ